MSLIKQLFPRKREVKFSPASADVNWSRIETLVHGPGAGGTKGEGDANSAVFACLMAIALAYPEPALRVYRRRGGRVYPIPETPLQRLLDKPTPNGELSLSEMWFWAAWATHTDGNAYWLKVRSGNAETGNVVEMWPVSPALMKPVTELDRSGRAREWISYYSLQVTANEFERVPVNNVIHFRLGIDDRDMRLGLSPLKRLIRQISSDEEATKFTDALLHNYAVPGLVIIPQGDDTLTRTESERIETKFAEKFSNDNRGAVAMLSKNATVQQFGFSPKDLDMGVLHRIPEERIAAVIGVPAIVAGLGAGLDRGTYSNARELREMFTETRLVPLWRGDADRLNVSLKPDFTSDRNVYLEFDLSEVRALQEDEDARYKRLNTAVQGIRPWITVNEARAEVGRDPVEGGDRLDAPAPQLPPPTPPGNERPPPAAIDDETEEGEGEKRLPFPQNGQQPTKSQTATKLTQRQLVDARRRVRTQVEKQAETAVNRWFAELGAAVAEAIAGKSVTVPETKAISQREVERLFSQLMGQAAPDLEEIIERHMLEVVRGSWDLFNIELGQVIQFDENDPLVRGVLQTAGDNIRGITQTTLDALRAELPFLYEEGLGIDDIAERVRGLITETYSGRAEAVARTEIGLGQQRATNSRYKAAGVRHVRVFDNGFDNSHEFCKVVNGKTVTLGWAERNPLQHPNCVRAFGAVFDYDGPVFTEERPFGS
jgi:HK97 family phage portal protein